MNYPSYINLSKKDWQKRIKNAEKLLNPCQVCPRKCGPNRLNNQKTGFCKMGENPVVSSFNAHFWEEGCLVGGGGSGTIFFTSCNLACVYCQNFEISQLRIGSETTLENLAQMMATLQKSGCHNINFVSPTIWVPQIIKALPKAIDRGLNIPLVYNTGGYDSPQTLKLLDGIVDIYMPDIKYSDNRIGAKYSLVADYWTQVQKAVSKMHKQVGDLIIKNGMAKKGLLIRHLVLPNNLAGTKKIMKFLSEKISKDTYVNIMAQYHPVHKAYQYPKLSRRITNGELKSAYDLAKKFGLYRFDKVCS